jgi:hypothetical protein
LVRLADAREQGVHLHVLGGVRCTVLEVANAVRKRTGASVEHGAPAKGELSACFSVAVHDEEALMAFVDEALSTV